MKIKRLDSGYWHYQLDANRFAQWPYPEYRRAITKAILEAARIKK